MSNIQEILNDYITASLALKNELKERGQAAFADLAKSIFDEHSGLKGFGIIGYTPSFADGDPCTHRSNLYVGEVTGPHTASWDNNRIYYCIDAENEEMIEFLFPEYDEDDTSVKPVSINADVADLDAVAQKVAVLEDVAEKIWNTNFIIKVYLDVYGDVVVEQDEYDCGY